MSYLTSDAYLEARVEDLTGRALLLRDQALSIILRSYPDALNRPAMMFWKAAPWALIYRRPIYPEDVRSVVHIWCWRTVVLSVEWERSAPIRVLAYHPGPWEEALQALGREDRTPLDLDAA